MTMSDQFRKFLGIDQTLDDRFGSDLADLLTMECTKLGVSPERFIRAALYQALTEAPLTSEDVQYQGVSPEAEREGSLYIFRESFKKVSASSRKFFIVWVPRSSDLYIFDDMDQVGRITGTRALEREVHHRLRDARCSGGDEGWSRGWFVGDRILHWIEDNFPEYKDPYTAGPCQFRVKQIDGEPKLAWVGTDAPPDDLDFVSDLPGGNYILDTFKRLYEPQQVPDAPNWYVINTTMLEYFTNTLGYKKKEETP